MKKRTVTAVALASLIGTGVLLGSVPTTVFAQKDVQETSYGRTHTTDATPPNRNGSTRPGATAFLDAVVPAESQPTQAVTPTDAEVVPNTPAQPEADEDVMQDTPTQPPVDEDAVPDIAPQPSADGNAAQPTPVDPEPHVAPHATPGENDVIPIPDAKLKAILNEILEQSATKDITKKQLESITEIESNNAAGVKSLEGLQYCINLKQIYMYGTAISDLSPLSELINLKVISMPNAEISDLSPLSKLTNLRKLVFLQNRISNISALTNLVNLEVLTIDSNNLSDLSPLSNLTNLVELDLAGNQITDITPLSGLTNLKRLILGSESYDFTNKVSDITPLRNLTNLGELLLIGNEVSDLSPISGLTKLTTLFLHFNKLSDVSPLSGLTNLTDLTISYNQIRDISPLRGLTNLTSFWMDHNQVSDISPIASFTKLQSLYLNNNQIYDLTPLRGLSEVRSFQGHEQAITLEPVRSKKTVAEAGNMGRDVDGTPLYPGKLSHPGRYKEDAQTIRWTNITEDIDIQYQYSTSVLVGNQRTDYQCTVTQPIRYSNDMPVITGTENITLVQGTAFDPVAGVQATDTEDGDLSHRIEVEGADTLGSLGVHELTYTVSDTNHNKTTAKRTVTVIPMTSSAVNQAPTITAADQVITVGDPFHPLDGVTAHDAEDGAITLTTQHILSNDVNVNQAGTYSITYQVTDSQGAKTTKTITVKVNPMSGQPDGNPSETPENPGNSGTDHGSSPNNPDGNVPATGDTGLFPYLAALLASVGTLFALKKKSTHGQ